MLPSNLENVFFGMLSGTYIESSTLGEVVNTKRKSRILDEVHVSAKDLHEIGIISKLRMSEFETLCNLEVNSPQHN